MNPDLTDISNKILALLDPLKTDYQVQPWPDNADNYELTHPKGAILVIFKDWQFQAPEDTVGGDQPTNLDFQISILNRSLLPGKTNPGAYDMIGQVYDALHGQKIETNYLQCRRITLVSQKNALFHYAEMWRLPNYQL